jgi:hypothetical protein
MQLKLGGMLCLALALLTSCRKSTPPTIEICILDSNGGADCIERDGSKLYRPPSQLENYWATSQSDQAAFAAWCYAVNRAPVEQVMEQIALDVKRGD